MMLTDLLTLYTIQIDGQDRPIKFIANTIVGLRWSTKFAYITMDGHHRPTTFTTNTVDYQDRPINSIINTINGLNRPTNL